MENPAKYLDAQDKYIAEMLKSADGFGTIATRADIIEKVIQPEMQTPCLGVCILCFLTG
ncbi:hypothetical protein PGC35_18865 [Psychrobacillus sp. PGGUH221]|uniref:hypothetical protein n=1 Tax=Bacillaceae TaxID=186817 RepID=UPI000AB892A2|nr:hypothetical protein [Bacillus sp. FJAT-22090]